MRFYSLFSRVQFISTCSLAEAACKALNKQTLGSEEYFHTVKNSGYDKYIFFLLRTHRQRQHELRLNKQSSQQGKNSPLSRRRPRAQFGIHRGSKKNPQPFKLGYCFLFNTLCQHVLWSGAFWRAKHERNKLSIRTVETKGCLWSSQRPGNRFL